MSRFIDLLEKYHDQEESPAENEELARLIREHDGRARSFYDSIMLEVDLYESYSGIARLQAVPPRRGLSPRWTLAWAVAVFLIIGLLALLWSGLPHREGIAPTPKKEEVRPPAPPPSEAPARDRGKRHEDDDDEFEHRGKRAEIEREFQKGMREVERKRAQGNLKEAEEKLREIERERDRKLNALERRGQDR